MIGRPSRFLALLCGAVLVASGVSCSDSGSSGSSEQPSTEPAVSPYARTNTCLPGEAAADNDTARRLTDLSRNAGRLLIENGIAPGPSVAVDGQLSVDQAADRASTVPGDASIIEALWSATITSVDNLGPVSDRDEYYNTLAERISTLQLSDQYLSAMLGPRWAPVLDVVERFAATGYEQLVEGVRASPPMRKGDAAATRAQLRAFAVDAGLKKQWETAQTIVTVYFQSCSTSAQAAGVEVDLSSSVLAEVLAADAVAAAFSDPDAAPDSIGPLSRGLDIALGADPGTGGDLTKDYDPNEILSPEDAELMDAEEPNLEGP